MFEAWCEYVIVELSALRERSLSETALKNDDSGAVSLSTRL